MIASFFVAGMPETKGSWRNIGRGLMKPDNPREASWAAAIGWAARAAMRGREPTRDRVEVRAEFVLAPRPNKTKKNQRDLDKLLRSALDALTGLVYADDEQVDRIVADKLIGRDGVRGLKLQIVPHERCSDVIEFPAGALEWMRSGERGTSSEAIFTHLTGFPLGKWMHTPADPDDMRRCRELLKAVPAFRARLEEMATVSRRWAALVTRWDDVCSTIDRNGRKGYELMQAIEVSA